ADEPGRCEAMGAAAHRRVHQKSGVADAASSLRAVYRRAVAPPMTPGLVSVIIAARDAAEFIGEAVASVQAQQGPPVELVVIDDDSADDTGARAVAHDPSAVVVRQCRGGPGAARNAGLALTSGEYVALLDADDRWPPGRLARLVGELAAEPR